MATRSALISRVACTSINFSESKISVAELDDVWLTRGPVRIAPNVCLPDNAPIQPAFADVQGYGIDMFTGAIDVTIMQCGRRPS